MPNLTPSDVHTDREVQPVRCKKCRRMNCRHVSKGVKQYNPVAEGISKHGHKGEPGYELLHPGRGRHAVLPAGWTGESKAGVFHGPNDYRLTYDPQDGKMPWLLERQADAQGKKFNEIKRYPNPDKAFAGSRGHFRKVKSERAQKASAEAAATEERNQRIVAQREDRARRTRLESLPGRRPGTKRPNYRSPNPVDESKVAARTLPGPADAVSINNAKAVVRAYPQAHQRKYAERVSRLGARGVAIDPTKRQEMSEKYGTSVAEMLDIEDTIYGVLFPQTAKKKRATRTITGMTQPTGVQLREADTHGARRITVLHGNARNGRNEGIVFKATKGPHRGKFVMVSWNGSATPIDDASYASKVSTSAQSDAAQKKWREEHRWSHKKGAFISAAEWEKDRDAENAALDQAAADLKQSKSQKIAEAQKWAKAHGFDPEDSYWWSFYWRDPSLLKSHGDEETDLSEHRAPLKPAPAKKQHEMIPAGELPLGRRKRAIKGWRYKGGVVIAEHKQDKGDGKGGDYRVYRDGKQIASEHFPTKFGALQWLKDWIDRIVNGERVQDLPAGPTKQMHKPTEYGRPQIDEHGNPIPKGTRRRRRVAKHGDPDTTPAPIYRAMHPNGRRGHGPDPWTGHKLNRLPRQGQHQKKDVQRKYKPSTYIDPLTAQWLRNNGDAKISDKRLREIFENPDTATDVERVLILSAGGSIERDGKRLIPAYSSKHGAIRKYERYDMVGQIRGKMAAGSGDRSAKRKTLSDERRSTANRKRAADKKNSNAPVLKKMIEDWSVNGKTMTCVFCGKPVSNAAASMETPKPKELKGAYTRGNVFPAHKACNTKANAMVMRDPVGYYEMMFGPDFYFNPKKVPPEVRKKMDPVFKKSHRRFFA